MKIKKGFFLRSICGENIVVAEGKENIDFSNIISMNESSAYLWEKIVDKNFTADDLAQLLTDEYEVDYDTALTDAKALTTQWINAGLVDEE